jgi:hypothetical protein
MIHFKNILIICIVSLLFIPTVYALKADKGQVILEQLVDYNRCQSMDYSGAFCYEALMRWVDEHPDDAFEAGKMTRQKMNHWNAIPFFTKAWASNKGNCKDPDVKMAVISALALPPDDQNKVIPQAQSIGFEKCSSELATVIAKEAKENENVLKNSCKQLMAKNLLSGVAAKKCNKL